MTTQDELWMPQRPGPRSASALLSFRFHLGQWRPSHHDRQTCEDERHDRVGPHHTQRQLVQLCGTFGIAEPFQSSRENIRISKDERTKDHGCEDARHLVADAHDADASCSTFQRTHDGDIWIARRLQQGEP